MVKMKTAAVTLFAVAAVILARTVAALPTATATLEIDAKSALLMEASTGTVLYELNKDERLAPASVTKVMSMLLVMESLESGRISLDDVATCSEYAAGMGGSQIWLEPGEKMSVRDLLKAVAVASANDATVVLAELISGSEELFVELMNKRAAELGMRNTCFKNSTGLPENGHYTSAYDIALMSRELLKHEGIFEFTTIWMDTVRGGKFGLANTNKLIRFYSGANGLKTGSTDEALFCISATALRDGMQLIAVVMGSPTSKARFAAASKLLDYGFANYSLAGRTQQPGFGPVPVVKGVSETVEVYADGDETILLPKGKESLLERRVILQPDVYAPVEKDQKLGEIVYVLEGEELRRIPIRAVSAVERLDFWGMLGRLLDAVLMK